MNTLKFRSGLVAAMLAALSLLLIADSAIAHGGAYQGPTDGGASAGGGTATGTPGGSGSGKSLGGGAVPGQPSTSTGSGGPTTRGGSGRSGASGASVQTPAIAYDGWEFWWESNRDRYLHLKDRVGRSIAAPGSPGQLTGRGAHRTSLAERPDQDMIDTVIIPALDAVSKSADDRDILDSSVLAMGRSASPSSRALAYENAIALLSHRELSVQASAALSLGVLHADDAWPLLTGLVNDDAIGRSAVGGGKVPWLVRSFSCLSLGLLGDARSVRSIMNALETLPDSERDIKASAIAALGLLQRGSGLAATAETYLLMLLDDPALDPYIRSYIPTSLGKLGGTPSLNPLLSCYLDSDTSNVVRQSAAIGLGQLATVSDEDILDALTSYVRGGRDQQTRHFSLIALAQIGGRDPEPSHHAETHARLRKVFLVEMSSKASSRSHRSWSALAAAVYARELPGGHPQIVEALRDGFRKERDPSFRGAFAIALALVDDQTSRGLIHEEFSGSHQEDFQGYAGEALGLLRHHEASAELLLLCGDKSISPTFRLKTATSLGLLGDRKAVPMLLATLDEANSLGGLASAANALGLIGDRTAVDPLMVMAGDDHERAASRAFACVALGLLGERTALPFNEALRAHNNYLAQLPAIAEVLRIL